MSRRASSPAGWPRSWPAATASRAPRSPGRASSTCGWPPTPRAPSSARCSPRARATAPATTTRAATSTWSSSPPTRRARCTWAAPAGPRSATRWAGCSPARGAKVTREYYFNDAGAQIDRFVGSLVAAAHGPSRRRRTATAAPTSARSPQQVVAAEPGVLELPDAERDEAFRRVGVGLMFDEIKRALHEFGTDFDVWFHEQSLHESGAVDAAVQRLKDSGSLYFADGAWWLRSNDFGDDKDRPVIKSDGNPAYIAGDLAYLLRQARARLRPVHLHARRRPPRLHRPPQGGRRRVRRRPGGGRGADRADGQPRQGRQAGADEQARRAPWSRWTTWSRPSASTRRGTR